VRRPGRTEEAVPLNRQNDLHRIGVLRGVGDGILGMVQLFSTPVVASIPRRGRSPLKESREIGARTGRRVDAAFLPLVDHASSRRRWCLVTPIVAACSSTLRHPLIEAWLERRLATSRPTTFHGER